MQKQKERKFDAELGETQSQINFSKSRCNLNVESAFAIICMSRPGIGANEESSTLQETRSSKSGEERGD